MKIEKKHLFCPACTGFFELIDPNSRCPYCFTENECKAACRKCIEHKRWQVQMGSALDYTGPVATFVKRLKRGKLPYLAKTGAAFLIHQFERLKWPMPDLILPVPNRNWFLGQNHAFLLAEQFSKLLQVPITSVLKRQMGDVSQARLGQSQRESLSADRFYLKKNTHLDGKVVLLIDDVLTTGTTLRMCAETVRGAFPKKVYALTLARSML